MKISKLHIDSFRHLENLDFDFTYPLDYKDKNKAGKPLDKICFIGQSATGKTGLLELMFTKKESLNNIIVSEETFSFKNEIKIYDLSITFENESLTITNSDNELILDKYGDERVYNYAETGNFNNLLLDTEKKYLYYFKANLISEKNIDLFSKNPIDLIEKFNKSVYNTNKYLYEKGIFGILFDDKVEPEMWLFLLKEILVYRKNFTQKMSELIHKGFIADPKKLSSEFEKWQKDNPNALEEFAEKLNPILEKLNLEVDLVNTEYSIPIKNKKTEEIIPIQNTSTGTKGLLLSFLPLFKLETKDSIILIDEPERSLYPDMQMDLMDHYQRLAPDAQFIVATHSPFIAAAFEPEERFILYFDEEGKVAVRRGESPIGDDPNDMLKNDFGLEFLMNKKGLAAFERFKNLKKQIASEKDETIKDNLLTEILELANDYKF